MTDRSCPLCHKKKSLLKYVADEFKVVSCRSCGFVYTANPVEEEQAQETYDEYYHASQAVDVGSEAKPDRDALVIFDTRLQAIQKAKPSGSMLEIGCGRGYFLNMAAKAGYRVKGIEISPAAAHYAGLHFGLDVEVADFESMELDDEKYDVIVMWHVLEHFRNPLAVLESVYSFLKDDGVLFIEVPNLKSLKFRLMPLSKKWQGGNHPRYHMSFFTRESLTRLLRKIGFRQASCINMPYHSQNNFIKSFVKSLLNMVHQDSFLTVKVYK